MFGACGGHSFVPPRHLKCKFLFASTASVRTTVRTSDFRNRASGLLFPFEHSLKSVLGISSSALVLARKLGNIKYDGRLRQFRIALPCPQPSWDTAQPADEVPPLKPQIVAAPKAILSVPFRRLARLFACSRAPALSNSCSPENCTQDLRFSMQPVFLGMAVLASPFFVQLVGTLTNDVLSGPGRRRMGSGFMRSARNGGNVGTCFLLRRDSRNISL